MNYTEIFSNDNPGLYDVVVSRYEDKLSTKLDEETIILDMSAGIYSQLNTVGSSIWEMLIEPTPFGKIIENVVARYDTTEEECIHNILNFLRNLATNNLIQIDNESLP